MKLSVKSLSLKRLNICFEAGTHLASVVSWRERDELMTLGEKQLWIGGTFDGNWTWTDGNALYHSELEAFLCYKGTVLLRCNERPQPSTKYFILIFQFNFLFGRKQNFALVFISFR